MELYVKKRKNRYLENEAVTGNFNCTISLIYFWGTNPIGALNTMDMVQVTVLQQELLRIRIYHFFSV